MGRRKYKKRARLFKMLDIFEDLFGALFFGVLILLAVGGGGWLVFFSGLFSGGVWLLGVVGIIVLFIAVIAIIMALLD